MKSEDQEAEKPDSSTHIHQEVKTNKGNIIGQLFNRPNVFIQQSVSAEVVRPKNEQVLLKLVREEISSRLHQSLHNQVFLQLEKELRPKSVKRLWDAEIKIGLKDSEPISKSTQVVDLFNRNDISGKLLILGEPGSGKTTTILKLANALINSKVESQPDYPIPVLFSLASWKPSYSMMEWLTSELNSKYGVRKDIANAWVVERRLLPILDALDELSISCQLDCVHALNKFLLGEYPPLYLVVCSRNEEYESLDARLQLNGAIYLKELTDQQTYSYLNQVNQSDLWEKLTENPKLLKLVKSPFLLSIYILAYQDISPEQMLVSRITQEDEVLEYMLDFYIRRMMEREVSSHTFKLRKSPSVRQTRFWLIILAQQLEREYQTEFLIENIGLNWLDTSKSKIKYIYFLVTGLAIILASGLIGSLSAGIVAGFKESILDWLYIWTEISPDLNIRLIGGFVGGVIWGAVFAWPDSQIQANTRKIRYTLRNPENGLVVKLFCFRTLDDSYLMSSEAAWNKLVGVSNRKENNKQYKKMEAKAYRKYGKRKDAIELYKKDWIEIDKKRSIIFRRYFPIAFLLLFLIASALAGMFAFVVFGGSALLVCLFNGFQVIQINENMFPNEGIWRSAKNAILGTFFGVIVGSFIGSQTVMGGIYGGMLLGGKACIQHFTIRLILYIQGSLPWNYNQFLDHCTKQLLIQKVGGRYRFMHKLLQEHFAAMPSNQTYPTD